MESTFEHGPNSGIESTRRTMVSQRTVNSGLAGCLSPGVHRNAKIVSLPARSSSGTVDLYGARPDETPASSLFVVGRSAEWGFADEVSDKGRRLTKGHRNDDGARA